MRITRPPLRLYMYKPGDEVKLHGDGMQRVFIYGHLRDDGYVALLIKDKEIVTAAQSHRCVK